MRRLFYILFTISVVFLLMSCNDSKKEALPGFVYLEDGVFKVNGEKFFPLMVNYRVDYREIGNDIVVSPTIYYENVNT